MIACFGVMLTSGFMSADPPNIVEKAAVVSKHISIIFVNYAFEMQNYRNATNLHSQIA